MDDVFYSELPRIPRTTQAQRPSTNFFFEDGYFRNTRGQILLPRSQLFFFATACHATLPHLGHLTTRDKDSLFHHQEIPFTVVFMSKLLTFPDFTNISFQIVSGCSHCRSIQDCILRGLCTHRKGRCMACVNDEPELKPNYIGLQWAPVDQKGIMESLNFTEMLLETIPDFSWKYIRQFYVLVWANLLTMCSETVFEEAYNLRKAGLCKEKNHCTCRYCGTCDYPQHQSDFSFSSVRHAVSGGYRAYRELRGFVKYIGISENYGVFCILNRIIKLHHLVAWLSRIKTTMPKYMSRSSGNSDLDLRGAFYLYFFYPSDLTREEPSVYMVVCLNQATRCLAYILAETREDARRMIEARILAKRDFISRIVISFSQDFLLKYEWLLSICQPINIAVECTYGVDVAETKFIRSILLSYKIAEDKDMFSDVSVLGQLPHIVMVWNGTYIRTVKEHILKSPPNDSQKNISV